MTKKIYNPRLGRNVAKHAKGGLGNSLVHVIPTDKRNWTVVKDGKTTSLKKLSNKNSAIKFAKTLILVNNGQVVLHNSDGTTNEILSIKRSY